MSLIKKAERKVKLLKEDLEDIEKAVDKLEEEKFSQWSVPMKILEKERRRIKREIGE